MILISERKHIFVVFATDSSFFFFFGLRHQFGQKKPEFLAKTFLFWSAGMVAARWNFIRTECGPLVQKDADPCCRASVDIKATKFEMECRTQ